MTSDEIEKDLNGLTKILTGITFLISKCVLRIRNLLATSATLKSPVDAIKPVLLTEIFFDDKLTVVGSVARRSQGKNKVNSDI